MGSFFILPQPCDCGSDVTLRGRLCEVDEEMSCWQTALRKAEAELLSLKQQKEEQNRVSKLRQR